MGLNPDYSNSPWGSPKTQNLLPASLDGVQTRVPPKGPNSAFWFPGSLSATRSPDVTRAFLEVHTIQIAEPRALLTLACISCWETKRTVAVSQDARAAVWGHRQLRGMQVRTLVTEILGAGVQVWGSAIGHCALYSWATPSLSTAAPPAPQSRTMP